ncbi:ABC transporter ATP-binding protein [Bacillus subtilis]|uniref:ABC transporter ATP-binding protein n=1 Tax=Pseudochrobactrum asaccharolyticum TaxID=354351 RepID=UPI001F18422B|nr:ABC transporter ATP-binding protein [Pseudochrobactrum asaccharolyticum]MCF7647211.1 ABC transporter ATP-binding protein [Pseudochrobactrum asaccharolyticum]MCF7673473.1 ABC transporter ATP-binding protein [Bacillus subtilis]
MTNSLNALKISNLRTSFFTRAGEACAVNGINLTVGKGEIVGLVGESGSGKTVTGFSIMGLIDEPGRIVEGSIELNGEDLVKASSKRLAALRGDRLAMIFQDPMMTLNPVMRIDEQMMETILIHHKVSKKEARIRSQKALEAVGIPSAADRLKAYPHELSGGMRQRVAIAIALINNPDVIIADEPTTALDVTIQAQILYLVRDLARNHDTGLIWVTHDLGVAAEIANRIAVMYAGRIVEQGPANEILDRPRHPYTEGLIRSLPEGQDDLARLYQIPGMTPSLLNLPKGCPFAPRCERAAELCHETLPDERNDGVVRYRCHYPSHLNSGGTLGSDQMAGGQPV